MFDDQAQTLSESDQHRLADLVDEYELAIDKGTDVNLERLCGSDSHLIGPLRARLEDLRLVGQALHLDSVLSGPKKLGDFDVLEQIGVGGTSYVYRCRQPDVLDRKIAVKVLRPTFDPDEQFRTLRREVTVLNNLDIKNVPQIITTGIDEWNGIRCPWLAMEFVDGVSIDEYVCQNSLPMPQVLNLFLRVCEVVEVAHQRGVVHRDLKPNNILIQKDGTPYILDFGIATIVSNDGSSLTTQSHQSLSGTAAWMAPELILEGTAKASIRSDIFSLGVILYRLLTNKHPYDAEGLNIAQISQRYQTDCVAKISTFNSQSTRDLDLFVVHLLNVDPDQRYQSVGAVITDLKNLLAGEPIHFRQISIPEACWRWTRRHRFAASVIGVIFIAAMVVGAFYVDSSSRIRGYADKLKSQNQELESQSGQLKTALSIRDRSIANARLSLIQASINQSPELGRHQLEDPKLFPASLHSFAWKTLNGLTKTDYLKTPGQEGVLLAAKFSNELRFTATISDQANLRVWDIHENRRVFNATGYLANSEIRFSPDDKKIYAVAVNGGIVERSTIDGSRTNTFLPDIFLTRLIDLSSDGKQLVTLSQSDNLILLDLTSGQSRQTRLNLAKPLVSLWFQDKDSKIGGVTKDGSWRTWDAETLEAGDSVDLQPLHSEIRDIKYARLVEHAFNEYGMLLARGYDNGIFLYWKNQIVTSVSTSTLRDQSICGLEFIPPASVLLSGRHETKIYDTARRRVTRILKEQGVQTSSCAVSNDGRHILLGSEDGSIHLYGMEALSPQKAISTFAEFGNEEPTTVFAQVSCIHVLPDQLGVLAGHRSGWLTYWDSNRNLRFRLVQMSTGAISDILPGPESSSLYCSVRSSTDAGIIAVDLPDLTKLKPFDQRIDADLAVHVVLCGIQVSKMCMSKDHRFLFAATRQGEIIQIDTSTHQIVHRWQAHHSGNSNNSGIYALDLCGERLVSGGHDQFARVWDTKDCSLIAEWQAHDSRISGIQINSLGDRVITASTDGTAAIWTHNGDLLQRIVGHFQPIFSLAISPDDQTVATGDKEGIIRIWDAQTGDAQIVFETLDGKVKDLKFVGNDLYSVDSTIRIWGPPD